MIVLACCAVLLMIGLLVYVAVCSAMEDPRSPSVRSEHDNWRH